MRGYPREEIGAVKIDKIEVVKLFNRFSYTISFENKKNVSILIAPNGYGKTTIFNFINFLFNPCYETITPILRVPFEKFTCKLSNGKSIELTRNAEDDISTEDGTTKNRVDLDSDRKTLQDVFRFEISISADHCDKASFSFWQHKRLRGEDYHNHFLMMEDTSKGRRGHDYPEVVNMSIFICNEINYICEEFSKFLNNKIGRSIPISFITANRLNDLSQQDSIYEKLFRRYGFVLKSADSENQKDDVLDRAVLALSNLFKSAREKYSKRLAEAKNTLLKKYLAPNEKDYSNITLEEFIKKRDEYCSKVGRLHDCGLLSEIDYITTMPQKELQDAFKNKRTFLMEYLNAFDNTLEPLERIYSSFNLFSDILSKRNKITHKELKVSLKGELVIESDGNPLDIHCLSSGEKNDFLMFFQLIFLPENEEVILIDEPEISWHIEWQLDFLDRLLEICKMNNQQAIVATHSPSIVNRHTDLFAQKGIVE